MILRSLSVEHWRCFAEAIEVGPFSDGLNVIHGPNGAGKSTLLWALARALFDSHRTTGGDIQSLRPWGRKLSPRVTVEFEHDAASYKLTKQFLTSRSAELSRKESGRYAPLAEGRDADQAVRKMLLGDAPGRGATKPANWGWAQVLWATQGEMHIENLSGGTRNTIQDALGAQVSTASSETIESKVHQAYLEIFTPSTGQLRSGEKSPKVVGLSEQLNQARMRRDRLQKELEEFEEAARAIEDLKNVVAQHQARETQIEQDLAREQRRAAECRELTEQRRTSVEVANAAQARCERVQDRDNDIERTRQSLSRAQGKLAQLQEDLPSLQSMVQHAENELEQAQAALVQIRARREQIDVARRRAERARRYAEQKWQRDRLNNTLKQVDSCSQELAALRTRRGASVAPDEQAMRRIRKAAQRRDQLRAKLDATSVTLHIVSEGDLWIEPLNAEPSGLRRLEKGHCWQWRGSPEAALHIEGVGVFRAAGPSQSNEDLREQWQAAAEEVSRLTQEFGNDDLDQLQSMADRAKSLEGDIDKKQDVLEAILGGQSIEQLHQERTRCETVLSSILTDEPAWTERAPDPKAESDRAEEIERRFKADVDAAERRREAAATGAEQHRRTLSDRQSQAKIAEAEVKSLTQRLQELTASDEDASQRRHHLAEERRRQAEAREKIGQIDRRLAEYGDDPLAAAEALQGQRNQLRTQVEQAQSRLSTAQGRLERIVSSAPYSALSEEEETVAALEAEVRRHELRNDAIRLLYETLTQRRREVVEAAVGPVRQRAAKTLRRIAGGRLGQIEFSEDFLPNGVSPLGHDETVSIDYLSGGEQEQVHFAVRLALADLAFKDERQLVVLDDAFTATDTARLARITHLLQEAAERFQVVLLSCHPERYRHLPRATFFDLEAIARANSELCLAGNHD